MLTNHKISNRITDAAPRFISVSVWSFEASPVMMPELNIKWVLWLFLDKSYAIHFLYVCTVDTQLMLAGWLAGWGRTKNWHIIFNHLAIKYRTLFAKDTASLLDQLVDRVRN